jgi:flagellar protein FlaG
MGEKSKPVYANFVGMEMTIYDMTLVFATKRAGENPQVSPEDIVAEVVMSPQHAKSFFEMFEKNLKEYEEAFGEINIQPSPEAEKKLNPEN